MSNTQHQLDQIKVDILKKNVCPDLAKTAQQLVMGAGDPDANIMFIGEAPGKKEDETGLPFVGAAGKFLDEMLASVGMHRDQVFITSIVKYRPPNNRDPKPEEKAAFLPYLLQQIAIIQPTVIVPLGRHGMEYFLPGVRISDIHGQLQEIEFEGRTLKVMPLYHPAAALYNGSMRQTLKDDFLKLTQLLDAA
ncbi:MAG TPA: uracil-DNA glycosylase [Candidatus Saccharimonadaceae bacterium]|nr:uracil-DNA glycosylase [Candidatus Saccharimonadaceae bacterium]